MPSGSHFGLNGQGDLAHPGAVNQQAQIAGGAAHQVQQFPLAAAGQAGRFGADDAVARGQQRLSDAAGDVGDR